MPGQRSRMSFFLVFEAFGDNGCPPGHDQRAADGDYMLGVISAYDRMLVTDMDYNRPSYPDAKTSEDTARDSVGNSGNSDTHDSPS